MMKKIFHPFLRLTVCFVVCASLGLPVVAGADNAKEEKNDPNRIDISDLNEDGRVDIDDLMLFSTNYLQRNPQTVDWCLFYESTIAELRFEGMKTSYFLKHFKELLVFIRQEFNCEGGPFLLELKNEPRHLFRVFAADNGDFYFSDPKVGSVFVYSPSLEPQLELKGLAKPLGVAVDTRGNLLVGNDGRDNVEVYDAANGNLVAILGSGFIRMPNNITIGPGGEVLVTDSKSHVVWVFDANYQLLGKIGKPGAGQEDLNFPVDAEVIGRVVDGQVEYEVFVADQVNRRIQVYDLQGNYVDTIEAPGELPNNCTYWQKLLGKCNVVGADFTRIQALSIDALDRLHVLDVFEAKVAVVNPATGALKSVYGQYGTAAGFLKSPMDVAITPANTALVVAGDGVRVEIFPVP